MSELEAFDRRLAHIEDTLPELVTAVAKLEGTFSGMVSTLNGIQASIGDLSKNTDKSSLLQKLLMGSIVVQSLLHGVTTPEAAKAAINQIFTLGGH